ncbi:hypothetical protein ACFWPU_10980 [Streptomyces sp. NPDC058471]|uniref:hypothetical protein n=1 Tax=Streptomyces sp. NPDC058471 TaxID=3346516 RepID=UPI00364AF171
MTTPLPEPPQPTLQIMEVDVLGADRMAIVVRCLETMRLGAEFHHTDQRGQVMHLTVVEIRRYPSVPPVPVVHPPHAARVILRGAGAGQLRLRPWGIIKGRNPAG